MDNFDIHKWNKNRYLGRIEENQSHLEFLAKYLNSMHPELTWEVSFGKRIDAFGSAQDLANFGNKYHGKKFGDYEVFHVDDDDRLDIVRIVKSDSIMRGENLNEASYMYKGYKDKHFDICPVAETLRDELLDGKFKNASWATGTDFETELGEWLYQHDVLFGTEKQVLKDKEGEESDIEKAKEAINRIINLSRDLGIPADRLGYLKSHLKKITDIVEYSSLTESIKETIRFIKENNPEFTTEEIAAELKEVKALGSQLNEKLCKKGEAYRKRRMAAGEKSSAYLSGRAVKVCKGQMSGKKKKK